MRISAGSTDLRFSPGCTRLFPLRFQPHGEQAVGDPQNSIDPLITMEVSGRHARTRAITCDTVSAANRPGPDAGDASRDVARVVSDVSVLCPRVVDESDNTVGSLEHRPWALALYAL